MSAYGTKGMAKHGVLRKSIAKDDILEDKNSGDTAKNSVRLRRKVRFKNSANNRHR